VQRKAGISGPWAPRLVALGVAGIKWRLFAWMQRRSAQAAEFFRMPTKNVVVLATEVAI
jgi:hypothetical protein